MPTKKKAKAKGAKAAERVEAEKAGQQDPQWDEESENEELIMRTNQSGEKEGGGYVTNQVCKATKEELKEGGCTVLDDCPLCLDSGARVRVGNHRSDQSTAIAQTGGGQDWNINRCPVRILGDDVEGPHSTAIIIGRNTVVACAHSLSLVPDEIHRMSKSKSPLKYLENYWIQPEFTKNARGECTTDNRIPLELYKFHLDNDWALFTRSDGLLFQESEIAAIDMRPLTNHDRVLVHQHTLILHCPVSLMSGITKVGEFSVGCNIAGARIQTESTHHVKYEGRDLCRGSSGGGVYVKPSTAVLGLHLEAINETDFDTDVTDTTKCIARTKKRVTSEDDPYTSFDVDVIPEKKKFKVDSETVASIAGGINGLGSALILCKFPRLMHYITEIEGKI